MTLEQRITLALQAVGADIKAILLKLATGPTVFADLFSDYVASGLTTPTSASLSSTTVAGMAYVAGSRLALAATARTYTAGKDTYVDLTASGAFTYTEVANAAAAPAQAVNTLRLAKVVTSASAITTVTDLRVTALILKNGLSITADGAPQTTGPGQAGSVAGNARGSGAVDLQTNRTSASQVASGLLSMVLGGIANTASGAYSAALGGASNTAGGNFSVASGYRAVASLLGQRAHASGFFAAPGDGQLTDVLHRMVTTTATPTDLLLDGLNGSSRHTILANQTVNFSALITAETLGAGTSSGWLIEGVVKRAGSAAPALVGTPTVALKGQDMAAMSWAIAVSVDTTNNTLRFIATGVAGVTIRWLAAVRTSEVTF